MTRYASTWKITWDPDGTPLVLLDYKQEMAAEPVWPWRQEVQEDPLAGAADEAFFPRGNVSREVVISPVSAHASNAAMRKAMLTNDAAWPVNAKHKLKVELEGDATAYETDAVFVSVDPLPIVDSSRNLLQNTIKLIIGPIAEVTP